MMRHINYITALFITSTVILLFSIVLALSSMKRQSKELMKVTSSFERLSTYVKENINQQKRNHYVTAEYSDYLFPGSYLVVFPSSECSGCLISLVLDLTKRTPGCQVSTIMDRENEYIRNELEESAYIIVDSLILKRLEIPPGRILVVKNDFFGNTSSILYSLDYSSFFDLF